MKLKIGINTARLARLQTSLFGRFCDLLACLHSLACVKLPPEESLSALRLELVVSPSRASSVEARIDHLRNFPALLERVAKLH
jgi:hypothetical protein